MNDAQLKEAIEVAKKEILEKLARDEPYLFGEGGLYHLVHQMANGKKTFTIKVQNGFVEELVIHTSIKKVFRKPNIDNSA